MWGIHNLTGTNVSFRRIGVFGIEVFSGFMEEITFNATFAQPAGAFEVPEIAGKEKLIQSTSVVVVSVVTSASVQKQALKVIGGATANLINYF